MNKETEVIFRKFKKGGDVIALFPYELGDTNPSTCNSYQTVGQHGAATIRHVINASRPASQKEIDKLATELKNIGYTVKIIKRNPPNSYQIRQEKLINYYDRNSYV